MCNVVSCHVSVVCYVNTLHAHSCWWGLLNVRLHLWTKRQNCDNEWHPEEILMSSPGGLSCHCGRSASGGCPCLRWVNGKFVSTCTGTGTPAEVSHRGPQRLPFAAGHGVFLSAWRVCVCWTTTHRVTWGDVVCIHPHGEGLRYSNLVKCCTGQHTETDLL